MTDLAPCPACRRHVRVDEAVCPFCAAALDAAPRALPVGRFARAVVFAGAVAGAAAGCGGKSKPPDGTSTGTGTGIGNEASAIDAGVPDAEPVNYPPPPPDDTCCMPYGAPPVRSRVV